MNYWTGEIRGNLHLVRVSKVTTKADKEVRRLRYMSFGGIQCLQHFFFIDKEESYPESPVIKLSHSEAEEVL